MIVLRIKENNREQNQAWMKYIEPHNKTGHLSFMREFKPGLFLKWCKVPTEGNHGPGPEYSWYTTSSVPSTSFKTKAEALAFWNQRPVGDVVPECIEISLKKI